MKIKANEKLFNEIREILDDMKENLPSIVQNDMEIDEEEFFNFLNNYESYINRLDDWMITVKIEIERLNIPSRSGQEKEEL